MLYFRRKDGYDIIPDETMLLARYLNDCPLQCVRIPDWRKEVTDVSEVLGKVLITPYNGSTIGVVEDGEDPYLRNGVIIEILKGADYDLTGMPHVKWSHEQVTEFMGLGEEELIKSRIYLPPAGGNPIRPSDLARKKCR
jgi:hypothetical protein